MKTFKACENDLMFNLNNDLWLGINDIVTENQWIATDGTTITYFNWANGEPDNSNGNEDGARFWGLYGGGKWNDSPVKQNQPVACTYRPFTGAIN